ncbi:hypothetical protein FB446DRAFT_620106, partial [Lentinula raphanica]
SALEWFPPAFAYINADLGPEYALLIETWVAFERSHGWVNARTGLQKTDRPAALTYWVQTARYLRTGNEPKLTGESVVLFAKEVLTWWVSLQPSWRTVDGQKTESVQEDVDKDWVKLDKSGRNGWYGLLACVKWWGTGIQ